MNHYGWIYFELHVSMCCMYTCEWKMKILGSCARWAINGLRLRLILFLEYHYILPPPFYSLESSLMQATLIPCKHWCHKWPHFSVSYWSIQYDTALLFVIQLTKSRHCGLISLPLWLSNTFHHLFFFHFCYLFLLCFPPAAGKETPTKPFADWFSQKQPVMHVDVRIRNRPMSLSVNSIYNTVTIREETPQCPQVESLPTSYL